MPSDREILGLGPEAGEAAVKAAFRRRVKEAHPDLVPDGDESEALRRHFLFMAVNQAYRRLMDGFRSGGHAPGGGAGDRRPRPDGAPPTASREPAGASPLPVTHADPAWAFYRNGMKAFMAIHPSAWNSEPGQKILLETAIAGHEEEQEELRERVRVLTRNFPRAYYCFSVVANEFPESTWSADARDKMALIESRVTMYRRIIESFGSTKPSIPRVDEGKKRTMPREWE